MSLKSVFRSCARATSDRYAAERDARPRPMRSPKSFRAMVEGLERRALMAEPKGVLDPILSTGYAPGWAYDPDTPGSQSYVDFYIDGAFKIRHLTDKLRLDVNGLFGITGLHGYEVPIPDAYFDGLTHTIQAYPIDTSGVTPNPHATSQTFRFLPPRVVSIASDLDHVYGEVHDDDSPTQQMNYRLLFDGGSTYTTPTRRTDANGVFDYQYELPPLRTKPATSSLQIQIQDPVTNRWTTSAPTTFVWPFDNTPSTSLASPVVISGLPSDVRLGAAPTGSHLNIYKEYGRKTLGESLVLTVSGIHDFIGQGSQFPEAAQYFGNAPTYSTRMTLQPGRTVSSWLVHYDRSNLGNGLTYTKGSYTFPQPIIGLITLGPDLLSSVSLSRLGTPGVQYETSNNGIEAGRDGGAGELDGVRVLSDGRTLEWYFRASGLDELRVVTEPDAPPNIPPSFLGSDTFSILENQTSVGTVSATDPDRGPSGLRFFVDASSLDGALFTISQTTGALAFQSAPDYEHPLDQGGDNTYDVNVIVSDGAASVTRRYRVVVVDQFTTSFVVNQGSSNRSEIWRLDVGLEDQASAASLLNPGRVRLLKRSTPTGTPTVIAEGAPSVLDGVLTIDFGAFSLGGAYNSTLPNGLYESQLDVDGDGVFETSNSFFRLLGDVNGDRKVDALDVAAVDQIIALGIYSADADVNHDGFVDAVDLFLATRNRNRTV